MALFAKLGAEIWRDFFTDGVPSSGPWPISKADFRAWLAIVEQALSQPPVTTSNTAYFQGATDQSIIFNGAGTTTFTLLSASANAGRRLWVKTITAQLVNSASSNVVPLAGGSAGTAILADTAGKWALMQSDGNNWIIMASN